MDDVTTQIYQKKRSFLSYYPKQNILPRGLSIKLMNRHSIVEISTQSHFRTTRRNCIKGILRRYLKCIRCQWGLYNVKAMPPGEKVTTIYQQWHWLIWVFTYLGMFIHLYWSISCAFRYKRRHVCKALSWRTKKIHDTKMAKLTKLFWITQINSKQVEKRMTQLENISSMTQKTQLSY